MLEGQDGNHVFVHFTEIRHDPARFSTGFRWLEQGQKVTFILKENQVTSDSQKRKALDVEIVDG
ncbi:MAG: cold shock domain-containing protein [Alicyclobacillus sp.]|nr:cold shock domain-containing protein [Alicyclobacillus sp.]